MSLIILVDNPLDKEPDGTTAIADEVKASRKCCHGQHQSKMLGRQN